MSDKITVLLVEDDLGVGETTRDTISEKLPDVDVILERSFRQAERRIEEELPDMVVLDLFDDATQEELAGQPVWKTIWDTRFCPLVFHSAHDLPEEPVVPSDHPFVKFVKKHSGSDGEVAGHLQTFLPHVQAIRGVNKEISSVTQGALRDVCVPIWAAQPEGPGRDDILKRAVRRRVAAKIDLAMVSTGKPMHDWEQYIIPALGSDLLTGDLLRNITSEPKDATSYRLVLSPSCDMATGEGRKPLANILVAKCGEIAGFLKGAQLDGLTEEKLRKRLPAILTRDQCGGCIPLPELPGLVSVIPVMAASLKELELIQRESIGNASGAGINYLRVASVDSPFRERIAWAYLQVSGRPGMPESDPAAFIDSIVKATAPPKPAS